MALSTMMVQHEQVNYLFMDPQVGTIMHLHEPAPWPHVLFMFCKPLLGCPMY